jgi:hypothetical protein
LFANVLKKFFTHPGAYENKEATNEQTTEATMAQDIKSIIARSRDTIVSDALGVAALVVMLFVGLSLPGMV